MSPATPDLAGPLPDVEEPEPVQEPVTPLELVEVNPRVPFLRGPIEIVRNLRRHHHLVANFIARDVRLKYRDSALGYVWSLLEPLLLSAVYYFLFVILAGKPDHRHVVWIVLGVITWQFFSTALSLTVTCLTRNESMIKQVFFPREIFAVTAVGSQLVMSFMNLAVAVPLMIYFGIPPSAYLVMVPLGLILAGLLALGLGLCLACLNVVNRDVEHLLKFLTRAGMFMSPVMWTIEQAGNRSAILTYVLYNPMTVPITLVRNGVAGQSLHTGALPVIVSVAAAVLAFVVGAMIFKRYEAQVVKAL